MLRRAIGNLLSNALRYTPFGGRIVVTVSVVRDSSNAETVHLAVENTGDPIPPEHLSRLFDRFYRGDPSRNRSVEGCGLGLSLAREISQAHGGDLVLDSRESREGWVAFRLTLPTA